MKSFLNSIFVIVTGYFTFKSYIVTRFEADANSDSPAIPILVRVDYVPFNRYKKNPKCMKNSYLYGCSINWSLNNHD